MKSSETDSHRMAIVALMSSVRKQSFQLMVLENGVSSRGKKKSNLISISDGFWKWRKSSYKPNPPIDDNHKLGTKY